MRTTIDLEEDELLAAKAIARKRGVSIGKALSDFARLALSRQESGATRNGVPLFPLAASKGGKLATLDRRISAAAVQNGGEALELVTP